MSRVVLIVDSDTGRLVNAMGVPKESARFSRFAKRMLSTETNPTLDYGGNGGDTLTVSKGGVRGNAINLMADTVNVPGVLRIGGKTVDDIVSEVAPSAMDVLRGEEGQIDVTPYVEAGTGRSLIRISISQSVLDVIERIDDAGYVSKDDLYYVVDGLQVLPEDTLEDVKATLGALIERIAALSESSSGSSSPEPSELEAV